MKFKLVEYIKLNENDNIFTSASSYLGQRNSHISNDRGNGDDTEISKYTDIHHISGDHRDAPNGNNCIVVTKKMHKAIHNETIRKLIEWIKNSDRVSGIDDDILMRLFTLLSLEERDETTRTKRKLADREENLLNKFEDIAKVIRSAKAQYGTFMELVTNDMMNDPQYKTEWRRYGSMFR